MGDEGEDIDRVALELVRVDMIQHDGTHHLRCSTYSTIDLGQRLTYSVNGLTGEIHGGLSV